MELKYSPLSPYARKVRVVAAETRCADRLKLTVIDFREQRAALEALNPLGKIPALITDDGVALYDSPVICEYLDVTFGGSRLIPPNGARRWQVLTRAALGDGIADAAVAVRGERMREQAQQSNAVIQAQLRKVGNALAELERAVPPPANALDMSDIAVVCALDYLALRVPQFQGYAEWSALKAYLGRLAPRESFAQTAPSL